MELNKVKFISSQQGVVLVTALVFLISMTAVVAALMLNSSTDIKMSGASEERLIATQEAIGAVDETIADQVTGANNVFLNNNWANPVDINSVSSVSVNSIQVTNTSVNGKAVGCPADLLPTSSDRIDCNKLQIAVRNNYGRHNTSNVQANAGIMQVLPAQQQ